uniref:Major facilitator superfamily (MFS) profile domain-containing protein n=1 Tax=Noctiluca scintillans TaxID=2966 RepID=A0A7S1B1T5_NOCSC|mmetsp:Transcript_7720/g.21082  ORF Transcript_7720/g.21082 Transcript_7720/m.21082 type:complete len:571 (+) Transcript_7720:60-1772(+)|eukprot:CAMPEP_0194496990 /NCGR_PEP_ID=MMETSP0253-20130528/14076_1 /TAXON_ID=2966 /ORGANISM="Noctiluca scintillans" /LENGTH=570 /DNA_ID=CAMNT_0039338451 /DNA_START=66 /DNA_END=1778 /DNA_ORIENTATION=+
MPLLAQSDTRRRGLIASTMSFSSMPALEKAETPLGLVLHSGASNFTVLLVTMALIFGLFSADGAMLPAVFKALEERLQGATPVSLGAIITAEALTHSISVVGWGVVADRYDKINILMISIFCWGLLTLSTAFVPGVYTLGVVRTFAGFTGAAIGPVSQGVVGAVCPRKSRGRAFGFLVACAQFGRIFGLLLAGSTSHVDALGGWRGAFVIFAVLTLALSWFLSLVKIEIEHGLFSESRMWARLHAQREFGVIQTYEEVFTSIVTDMTFVLTTRSFWVLLLQGAFASSVITALQYQVMWLQYLGLDDLRASAATSATPMGCILGALLGGFFADYAASVMPKHGRILFGQVADVIKLSILTTLFVLYFPEDRMSTTSFFATCSLNFGFGFFSIMVYASVVKPLFTEIVPCRMIAQIIGLASAVDTGFAAFVGGPLVGGITQLCGYQETHLRIDEMTREFREQNAQALGKALGIVTITSTVFTILSFSLLHFTVPQDVKNSQDDELMFTEVTEEEKRLVGSDDEDLLHCIAEVDEDIFSDVECQSEAPAGLDDSTHLDGYFAKRALPVADNGM